MAYVIGIDFGNAYSFAAAISCKDGIVCKDETALWLVPSNMLKGYPSVLHVNNEGRKTYGLSAINELPLKNRRHLIKNHICSSEEICGYSINYDEEIVNLIKYIADNANEILKQKTGETTNLVSIAYPLFYMDYQADRLIELLQNVILETGESIQVIGKIKEPAAASLAFLSDIDTGSMGKYNTVLVFSMGETTFDASIVTLHHAPDGSFKSIDVIDSEEAYCAGYFYTRAVVKLIEKALLSRGVDPLDTREHSARLWIEADTMKQVLDKEKSVRYEYRNHTVEVTKQEYERAVDALLNWSINLTNNVYRRKAIEPAKIIMVGGQSKMPIIRKRLVETFPSIGEQNIILFKPYQAIAEGAARYGAILHK